MELNEAVKILEHHNKWRKGADIPMVSPTALGEAIDVVVKQCIQAKISYAHQT